MSNPTKYVDNLSSARVFHNNREDISRRNENRSDTGFDEKKKAGEM